MCVCVGVWVCMCVLHSFDVGSQASKTTSQLLSTSYTQKENIGSYWATFDQI